MPRERSKNNIGRKWYFSYFPSPRFSLLSKARGSITVCKSLMDFFFFYIFVQWLFVPLPKFHILSDTELWQWWGLPQLSGVLCEEVPGSNTPKWHWFHLAFSSFLSWENYQITGVCSPQCHTIFHRPLSQSSSYICFADCGAHLVIPSTWAVASHHLRCSLSPFQLFTEHRWCACIVKAMNQNCNSYSRYRNTTWLLSISVLFSRSFLLGVLKTSPVIPASSLL